MSTELRPLTDEYRRDYYNFCRKEALHPFLFTEETFSYLWERTKSPEERHFIILSDGEKCGFCEFHIKDGTDADLGVEIFPEFRRRGIAKEAVKLLMDEAVNAGCERLFWQVAPDNTASIRLALSLGGVPEGERTVDISEFVEGAGDGLTFLIYRLR